MKKTITLIAGLASAALLVFATPAQAGPIHVDLNVGIPVLVQSQPVYAQQYQPAYVQSRPVYVQQAPDYGYRYGDYWAQRRHQEHEWREHEEREHHEWHDHDREWHDHDRRDYRHD